MEMCTGPMKVCRWTGGATQDAEELMGGLGECTPPHTERMLPDQELWEKEIPPVAFPDKRQKKGPVF